MSLFKKTLDRLFPHNPEPPAIPASVELKRVQSRLNQLTHAGLAVDGVWGPATASAVEKYKKISGLKTSDSLAITYKKLFEVGRAAEFQANPASLAPWMYRATAQLGLNEDRDTSRLAKWLASDGKALGDPRKLPWCGDFVQTALLLTLPNEPMPASPYWARNWATFGTPCEAVYGAIATFSRKDGGHVAFVTGVDEAGKRLRILGGNQNNSVSEVWKSRSELLAIRWPKSYPIKSRIIKLNYDGSPLSKNEV